MCVVSKSFSKRGQFTIFVIIGLVIFFILSYGIYQRAKMVNIQLTAQADKDIKNYLDKNAINQYVTSCLDAVITQDLILSSIQGGEFNSTDRVEGKDYTIFYDDIYNRTINVSIVVDANNKCPDNRASSEFIVYDSPTLEGTPDYPYTGGYYSVTELSKLYNMYGPCNTQGYTGSCKNNCRTRDYHKYSGFFGVNNMKILCDPKGENAIISPKDAASTTNRISCDYYAQFDKSLQKYLEEKISNDLTKCVNFSEVLKRSPSNITVSENASAKIIFSPNSINVKVSYPFTIIMRNRQPLTKMVDFGVDKEISFKELYEYTYELLNYDVRDVTFDVVKNRMNVLSQGSRRTGSNIYSEKYEVQLIKGDSNNNFIDVLRVIDRGSTIGGRPLLINVGLKNRRPALDYIHDTSSDKFDIIALQNDTITINPKGYDPDSDAIMYSYSGWMEDYVDKYVDSTECKTPKDIDYVINQCTTHDISETSYPPHNWTKSIQYTATKQSADYKLQREDMGFHTLTVRIRDIPKGFDDYQKIRVLVLDLPKIDIKPIRQYDDIDPDQTSYEDIIVLDGGQTAPGAVATAMGLKFFTFNWEDKDSLNPFKISKTIIDSDPDEKKLKIPEDTLPVGVSIDSVDMNNIVDYIFKKTELQPAATEHTISLTADLTEIPGLKNTAEIKIKVAKCLNHRNDANPIYPYNDDPKDLYNSLQANHTCCGDDLEYKDSESICYQNTAYGVYEKIIEPNLVKSEYISKPGSPTENYAYHDTTRTDNDVFKRTFTRSCSGDRGNICSGNMIDTITSVNACDDYNGLGRDSEFNKERCSGPSTGIGTRTTEIKCASYTDETFEELAGYNGATGICTNGPQLADESGFRSSGEGLRYRCDGECNNGQCTTPVNCQCDNAGYTKDDPEGYCNPLKKGDSNRGMKVCGPDANHNHFEVFCSGACKPTYGTVCRASINGYTGCDAADDCNGRTPNTPGIVNNVNAKYTGCDSVCNKVECTDGHIFKNNACLSQCINQNECTTWNGDGYYCNMDTNDCEKTLTKSCKNQNECSAYGVYKCQNPGAYGVCVAA